MTPGLKLQPWIFRPRPNPAARVRLICVPYAGRGASVYREWPDLAGPDIDLCALQLPGRENRLREAPFTRLNQAIDEALEVLPPYLDRPFALFGHSMGAVICFELARKLRARDISPLHLFVSGRRAPQIPDRRARMSTLSDEAFVLEISRRYNGIPREVFQDKELLDLLLPALRADVELLETHEYLPGTPFEFPITAFGGRNDSETLVEDLEAWQTQTSSFFQRYILPGDHFFLGAAAAEILAVIRRQFGSVSFTSL